MQCVIGVSGALAIWLANRPDDRRRRWACLVGLFGQPFWLWSTWRADQFGMLLLSVFYTACWCEGVITHWLRPAIGRWRR